MRSGHRSDARAFFLTETAESSRIPARWHSCWHSADPLRSSVTLLAEVAFMSYRIRRAVIVFALTSQRSAPARRPRARSIACAIRRTRTAAPSSSITSGTRRSGSTWASGSWRTRGTPPSSSGDFRPACPSASSWTCGPTRPTPTTPQRLAELRAAGIPMRQRTASGIMHYKLMLFAGQSIVEFSGANFSADAWVFTGRMPYVNYVDESVYFTDNAVVRPQLHDEVRRSVDQHRPPTRTTRTSRNRSRATIRRTRKTRS